MSDSTSDETYTNVLLYWLTSGEVDPDEDDYPSSGGSDGDDFGADDY